MHVICPANLIILNLITRIALGEEYKSCSSSFCSFSPVSPYFIPHKQKYISQHHVLWHLLTDTYSYYLKHCLTQQMASQTEWEIKSDPVQCARYSASNFETIHMCLQQTQSLDNMWYQMTSNYTHLVSEVALTCLFHLALESPQARCSQKQRRDRNMKH